ncbi:hypothetical protein JCM8208_005498 [Rhodotorula glutinis]
MLNVINTSLRRVRSFRSPSPSSSRATSPPRSSRDYAKLRRRLAPTLPDDVPEWRVLTAEWCDRLGEEERAEVLSWAKRVAAVRENRAERHPHVPQFLEHALASTTDRADSSRGHAHDGSSTDADTDDCIVKAMLSTNAKAEAERTVEVAAERLPSQHRPAHVQRAIGRRAAHIYGTTKERWEAGRGW